MLDPNLFFGAKPQNGQSTNNSQKSISIQRMVQNNQKSKWDQPLTIPSILYTKMNVPMPRRQMKRQENLYPPSLLDYIKRAYQRCKNEIDSKNMQSELRKIIANFQQNLNQVSWQTYPIPFIPPSNTAKPQQKSNQVNMDRKTQIRLPSSYRIVQEEKPSKAMILAQKRLQKLNMSLNQQKKNQQKPKAQKTFLIGFQNAPPPPPPPPPQKEALLLTQKKQKQKDNKFFIPLVSSKQEPKPKKNQKKQKKINKKQMQLVIKSKEDDQKIDVVAKRFAEFNKIKQIKDQQNHVFEQEDNAQLTDKIVGKSKSIEKPYLRITGRANPETVRPQPVLKKALKHFLQVYNKGTHSYEYVISQFRSIRQDLTVQDIRNSFTVHVYEQNFKISLFENDQTQFKHLQTKIWQLYSQGLYHTKENRTKFYSYQMITLILQNKTQDMEYMLTQLEDNDLSRPEIQQKLRLRKIIMLGNYHGFFDFYNNTDHISRCLLSHYIDRVKIKCLLMVCKTFGQKISLAVLSQIIGEDEDVMEALIKQEKAVLENGYLYLKPSYEKFLKSDHLLKKKVTVLLE